MSARYLWCAGSWSGVPSGLPFDIDLAFVFLSAVLGAIVLDYSLWISNCLSYASFFIASHWFEVIMADEKNCDRDSSLGSYCLSPIVIWIRSCCCFSSYSCICVRVFGSSISLLEWRRSSLSGVVPLSTFVPAGWP